MKKLLLGIASIGWIATGCHSEPSVKEKGKEVKKTETPFSDNAVKILEKKNVEYAYPRWSQDGEEILFQSNETGLWQVFVMKADGSSIRQLTSDSSNNNFIDWSPNNNTLCFVSDRTGNEEIFVMDISGENLRQLTFNAARDIHPYWSPDGKRIFFNSTRDDQGDFEIYAMAPDGSSLRRITSTDDNETCARLSPDGDHLIYLRNNDRGLDDVFVMNLADSSARNVTNTTIQTGWPCWLPDSEQFVYSTKEGGIYKLFKGSINGNRPQRISSPSSPYWDGRAHISPDGTKIVFNRQKDGRKNTIGIYTMLL